MLVGSHDRHLYCLSAACGSLRWSCKLDSELYASPFTFRRQQQLNTAATPMIISSAGEHFNVPSFFLNVNLSF